MKTNMKRGIYILLCMLFSITIYAQDKAKDAGKLVGSWSFSAPEAPYGYQEGSVHFKHAEGKVTAELKINNSTISINDIQKKGDAYTCNLYVDGSAVNLSLKPKGDVLEGVANAEGSDIPVAFKRMKK